MTPVRTLTVCVGISAYPVEILEAGEKPLEFLATSARDLSELFGAIWSREDSRHLLAVDSDATLQKVQAQIIANEGVYDLLILYLGGHGRAGAKPFEFLFYGQHESEAVARSTDIDALAALPACANTLLLLDACYAGAFGEQTTFFRSIGKATMRLCIASSRKEQRSWEDPHFQRSLFADALAKALTDESTRRAPKTNHSGVL